MAELNKFSRYNMRCGLILKSKTAGERITRINIPELDQRFLVLTGRDLAEKNRISFFGGQMPILATDRIDYVGQPILAIFGPDYESADLMLNQVTIDTKPISDDERKALQEQKHIPSLTFSWGQEEEDEEKKEVAQVVSEFAFDHTIYHSFKRYKVASWQEGENIHIDAPMQWPELIRSTISDITEKDRKSIILHKQSYYTTHDEYLLNPAIIAVIATIASLKTGLPAEIRAIGEAAKPGIKIVRTTAVNEEHHPISESVKMTVDQGSFLFASEEYQRQAMTGLIPVYSLKSFKAEIEIISSEKMPASFSGSLGYAEALAASEYHRSRLADGTDTTPAQFRELVEREKTRFTDFAPAFSFEGKENVRKIVGLSLFNRKWASNLFQHGNFGLLGILRGIGIATGSGIYGFSSSLARERNFEAMMVYTTKKGIIINSSISEYSSTNMKFWRSIINSKFSNDAIPENFNIADSGSNPLDSGPNVLSRFTTSFTSQIEAAAKQMSALIAKNHLPLQLKFDTENKYSACEFDHSGCGAIIAEISISKKDFRPLVKEVWATLTLSTVISTNDVKDKARRSIQNTIKECGMETDGSFKLNLDITQDNSKTNTLASISSITEGLTMAALSNALYQAIGPKAAILPTSAAKLERIIHGDS